MTEFKKTRIMNIVGALQRLWKKYAEDFFKGVILGDTKKVDKEGREILTFFETLRAPDPSDKKDEKWIKKTE